jgi:hypothetical protein
VLLLQVLLLQVLLLLLQVLLLLLLLLHVLLLQGLPWQQARRCSQHLQLLQEEQSALQKSPLAPVPS